MEKAVRTRQVSNEHCETGFGETAVLKFGLGWNFLKRLFAAVTPCQDCSTARNARLGNSLSNWFEVVFNLDPSVPAAFLLLR